MYVLDSKIFKIENKIVIQTMSVNTAGTPLPGGSYPPLGRRPRGGYSPALVGVYQLVFTDDGLDNLYYSSIN